MNNIKKLKKFDTKRIPRKFYNGLLKLFYKLGIDGNDFIDDFIHNYLSYAYKQSQKRTDIYLATGFGRRYLEKYLKEIKSIPKPTKKTNHKTLIGELMDLAEKYRNGIIPIYGKIGSFNSLFNKIKLPSKDITARSLLEKLIRVGVIEKIDNKHIHFITSLPPLGFNEPDDIIRILSNNMNRLCHTLLRNMNVEKNDDGVIQISIWSNSIDPKNHKGCTDSLREEVRKCMKNCEQILIGFEEKGLSKKTAEANNIEIGLSVFIFKNPNDTI